MVLLLAGMVLAANNNTLTVKCVDESGKALAGVKVQIRPLLDPKWTDAKGQPKWLEKKSDNDGVAVFDKLDDGAYRVKVSPENLAQGFYELAGLKNGAQESVTVTCPAGDPTKKLYFDDPQAITQSRQLYDQALTLLQGGKFEEAEQQFKASLVINPSSPDTLYYLAVNLMQEKKWDDAMATLQKDQKIVNALVEDTPPPPKDAKGQPQQSQFIPIKQQIDKMMAMLPSLKIKVQATDELNKKNYKQAIALYEQILKDASTDPDSYYNLALAYAYDNQFDAAQQMIDKAIELKKDDQGYLDLKKQLTQRAAIAKVRDILTQADTAYNTKDFAGALKKYEEALPMLTDPKGQAGILDQIGNTRTQLGQADEAVQAYNQAIQLDPSKADTYKQHLATHYKIIGQHFLDQKMYEQAFAAFAEGGLNVFKLGQEWSQKDETADIALAAFQQVIKTDPQNAESYYEMGMVYWLSKKDGKLAKENLSKYIATGKDEAHIGQAKDIITMIDRKK